MKVRNENLIVDASVKVFWVTWDESGEDED
jgi:hypothetical protein